MTVEYYKAMVPIYAAQEEPESPKSKGQWSFTGEELVHGRFDLQEWLRNFKQKNGIALILILAWSLTLLIGCLITAEVVRRNTTERVTAEVTSELRQGFQEYLEQQEQARMAAGIVTGDDSRQAAISRSAQAMAKAFEGIKAITVREDDLRTYGWNMCFRASNKYYPDTIEGVVAQPNQYMGYSENNPVVDRKLAIATDVVTAYFNGEWPESDRFLYAEWDETGKIILRDEYQAGRNTNYWWWGK